MNSHGSPAAIGKYSTVVSLACVLGSPLENTHKGIIKGPRGAHEPAVGLKLVRGSQREQ